MIPETKRAQIIDALKANPNASAVAREVGASHGSVKLIAKAAKIDLGRGGLRRFQPKRARRLSKPCDMIRTRARSRGASGV